MSKPLPARPDLDHLRRQAKVLLSELRGGVPSAAQAFIAHLPEARTMKPAAVRAAGFRLADAQSVVARRGGFASWPALSHHVQQLRALEGEWCFASLEVDGAVVPATMLGRSRLLIDGDRFRSESPEATYEGVFSIDVEAIPATIDIEFVEGPEAGGWSYGVYDLADDTLRICLGLTGSPRPKGFMTTRGSGHALEHLRRASGARPANVAGGTRPPAHDPQPEPHAPPELRTDFDVEITPELKRLEGDWVPVALVTHGQPMAAEWLGFGSRTATGREMKVIFGGQVMVHAKVRLHPGTSPLAVDYLHLSGASAGQVSLGILEWIGDEVQFLMGQPGHPRPAGFDAAATGTLSRWRRPF